jgi:tetratricopeptide (TPR) repeat protein
MITDMKVRCVTLAYVSAAFLAATAMNHGTAFANSSSDYVELVRQAYQDLQQGDATKAIGEFSQAIDSGTLEPEIAVNALLNRALAWQQTNEHEKAIDDYSSALKMNVMAPALRATALYNRGLSQQKLNQLGQAVEDYTGALLLNPQFSQAFYNRANALRDSGQLLFALSDYERAIRYKYPDASRVYMGTGTTYLALKRPLDAQKAFNEALKINPNLGEARAQLVLLGDQQAKADTQVSDIDPILTASVSSIAGGTTAVKKELPAAVEPPEDTLSDTGQNNEPALTHVKKLITERLSEAVAVADASQEEIVSEPQKMAVADIPAIPKPAKSKMAVKPQPVADEIVETASIDQTSEVAETIESGWVVQVASATSEDGAWSSWKKISTSHKVLTKEKPNVVKADLGAKGIFYRVRLGGFTDQAEAKSKCAKLKAGGVGCYVSKAGS